jgi:hypothetical protein
MKIYMKKILMTVFFLTFISFGINGQTYVSGFINANTTWDLAGSPYIVTGNALLSHGLTLIINPGVVIKFDSDKALQIDGELIAIGTPQNRITFTSNQSVPQAGDWAKLHFADTCVNATFDSFGNYISGCIMKYCYVLYGGGIGYGAIHIESSSPYISHCSILNSLADGIHCTNSLYVLDSSAVKNCEGYGLYYRTTSINTRNPQIHGDTIENNANGGINFDNNSPGFNKVSITNNYFISNSTEGAIDASNTNFGNSIIANNYFINNSGSQGIIQIFCLQEDTIRCNKFINNHSNSRGCITNIGYSAGGMVTNNIFEGNTGAYTVIFFAHIPSDNFSFSNNYIANNSASGLGICYFSSQIVAPLTMYLDHNTFVNNTGSNAVYISAMGSPSSINFLYFKYNSFSDPGVQYELNNSIPYGSSNIYADSNYWGGTSTAHIDSVINDYFDYANFSVVYYSPILVSPIEVDTTCPPPDIITDINPQNETISCFIYPNPASNYFTIKLSKNTNNAEIKIYNLLGELEYSSTMTGQKNDIDISSLTRGMHIIQIATGDSTNRQKILKQ